MITKDISSIKDILDKNKTCPFCLSNLSLSANLALTKKNSGFFVKDNYINFNADPKFFKNVRINIENQNFEIEKINNGSFTNYRSVCLLRSCHFCNHNFQIKYSRFKYIESTISSVSLESISFKIFIEGNKNVLLNITNNYFTNETIVEKYSFENNLIIYEINENLKYSLIDFDYFDKDKIINKVSSILYFS